MDRITGRDTRNIGFVGSGPASIEATMKLVVRFAESRRAGTDLTLGGRNS